MESSTIEFSSCYSEHGQGVSVFIGGKRGTWYVTFDGETYVIESELPTDAYTLLDPYLKKDRFEQFYYESAESK